MKPLNTLHMTQETNGHHWARVQNTRAYLQGAGIEIHEANTKYGPFFFTIDGTERGEPIGHVWNETTWHVNGKHHRFMGNYALYHPHVRVPGQYETERDTRRSIVSFGTYQGPETVNVEHQEHYGWPYGPATPKAGDAIREAIGEAIRAKVKAGAGWDAERNARELYAQKLERDARYKRETAAREIADAEKLEQSARDARQGGHYEIVK